MFPVSLLLLAAPPQDGPPPVAKPVRDPNRVTCVNRVKTGSRTNFEQICHSQAEWDLLKRENRSVVERGQQQQNRMDRDPPGTRN
ncbi:hypothetical protein OF829_08540 [Sphingomonas sp. LB-2]|uniref:hypothetical protein n=1 Tax=Sphingomonas caeni TaxID=2984949 RepID=UPI00222F66A5|nr:hypothetical protein [Sphingomonas caeni]MCW3847287.1 hypothetical protein [Sphingomonas caeni]